MKIVDFLSEQRRQKIIYEFGLQEENGIDELINYTRQIEQFVIDYQKSITELSEHIHKIQKI